MNEGAGEKRAKAKATATATAKATAAGSMLCRIDPPLQAAAVTVQLRVIVQM
jgi:hypothetical protein